MSSTHIKYWQYRIVRRDEAEIIEAEPMSKEQRKKFVVEMSRSSGYQYRFAVHELAYELSELEREVPTPIKRLMRRMGLAR